MVNPYCQQLFTNYILHAAPSPSKIPSASAEPHPHGLEALLVHGFPNFFSRFPHLES